jgi:hypothetical protein
MVLPSLLDSLLSQHVSRTEEDSGSSGSSRVGSADAVGGEEVSEK